MSYTPWYERLRDPRWQKKRLEVMQRDEFRCRNCFSDAVTLNVHHAFYERGRDPWEYENEFLLTLCEPCHKRYHDLTNELLRYIAIGCLDAIEEVLGFAKANRTGCTGLRFGFRKNPLNSVHEVWGAAMRLYFKKPDERSLSDKPYPITTDDVRRMVVEDYPDREVIYKDGSHLPDWKPAE